VASCYSCPLLTRLQSNTMQQADRRRFGAPEGAVPLRFASTPTAKPSSSSSRIDGRAPEQVRPICGYRQHCNVYEPLLTSPHTYSPADWARRRSVWLCLHRNGPHQAHLRRVRAPLPPLQLLRVLTHTLDSYGPKPTPPSAPFNAKARLNVEVKFAPFSSGVRRFTPGKVNHSRLRSDWSNVDASAVQDTESASLSATLQQSLLPSLILEALPKSQIDLFLTILESDGSDADISACVSGLLRCRKRAQADRSRSSLCSGVTAASVALAEAGVQMYGLVVGCCAVSAVSCLLAGAPELTRLPFAGFRSLVPFAPSRPDKI
jgi:exosome complex component MTR3